MQLSIETNPGGASFRNASNESVVSTPITATMSKGVATFSGLALDKAGIGYVLSAAATNTTALLPATSNAFVDHGRRYRPRLGFLVQPTFTDTNLAGVPMSAQNLTINEYSTNTGIGNAWTGVVVDVVDQFGNQVTSGISGGTVTMTAAPAGGGTSVPFNTAATTSVAINPNTEVANFTNLQWGGAHFKPPRTATPWATARCRFWTGSGWQSHEVGNGGCGRAWNCPWHHGHQR